MCRGVRVQDEWTYFCGIWVKNRSIVIVLAMAQFIVATVSLAQHVYSVANFNNVSCVGLFQCVDYGQYVSNQHVLECYLPVVKVFWQKERKE